MEPEDRKQQLGAGEPEPEVFNPPPGDPFRAILAGRWSDVPFLQKVGVILLISLLTPFALFMLYVAAVKNGSLVVVIALALIGFVLLMRSIR